MAGKVLTRRVVNIRLRVSPTSRLKDNQGLPSQNHAPAPTSGRITRASHTAGLQGALPSLVRHVAPKPLVGIASRSDLDVRSVPSSASGTSALRQKRSVRPAASP